MVWTYDGCVDRDASMTLPTLVDCIKFIRLAERQYAADFEKYPKLGLDVLDLSTGRLTSYVL